MIKNIIFDLGVVLLNVDYSKTIRAFGDLGLKNPEEAFSKAKQDDFFRAYEKGKLSDKDFLEGLSKRMDHENQVDIMEAWCAMLDGFPREKFELLKNLSSDYRLFILSNTNSLHQKHFENTIDQAFGWKNFAALFDHIGYSHELGERKPDREAFLKLMRENDLEAQHTLFIDDTVEHVKSAKNIGLIAIHYTGGKKLLDEIEPFLITSS